MSGIELIATTRDGNEKALLLREIVSSRDVEIDFAFKENTEYQFSLKIDNTRYKNPKLFIGDIPTKIEKHQGDQIYYTHHERYFLNVYELSQLQVSLLDAGNNKVLLSTKLIAIMTRKMSSNIIDKMLIELEELDGVVLDALFGKSKVNFGVKTKGIQSVHMEHYVEKTEKLIELYRVRLNDFRLSPHVRVVQKNKLLDYKDVKQMSTEGFSWLLKHPDMMEKVDYETGVKIQDEFYIPSKAMSVVSINDTDTYENRVILNMLPTVIQKTEILKQKLENLISDNTEEFKINVHIPINYEIPMNSLHQAKRIYFKRIIKRCNKIVDDTKRLFYKYKHILKCKEVSVSYPVKYTRVFSARPHYKAIVDQLIVWEKNSNYNLQGTGYLFKLKSITEVYEFYCLMRILKALDHLNYLVIESDRIRYKAQDDDSLHNYYYFKNKNSRFGIKVYYEPRIKNSVSEDSLLCLYCNSQSKWKSPDFVIEFCDEITQQSYYGFFDAKYAFYDRVKNQYIQDVVLKYYHELSSPGSQILPSFFTLILHPGFGYNENTKVIIRNEGNGKYQKSLHSIGYINLEPEFKTQLFSVFFKEQIDKFESIVQDQSREY